jgi:hypothetical protein
MDMVRHLVTRSLAVLFVLAANLVFAGSLPNFCGISQWQTVIDEAALRSQLPSSWIGSVILAESAGCEATNGHLTTSVVGAMGLMQLMPATWERFRLRLNLRADAYNPRDNIMAGAAYLQELYARYGWPGAAAAYHAGPQRYEDYLKIGRTLPQATINYLARIDRSVARLNANVEVPNMLTATPIGTGRELFVEHKPADTAVDTHAERRSEDGLFVALRHSERHMERKPTESPDVQEK